jgi:peptidoglycan/LPS O-acetylase OafA/YrhL
MSVATPTLSGHTAATQRAAHLGGVDWLRIVGITAVAYFHTGEWYPDAPGAAQSFAGLHALTAAAAYFAAASRSAPSDRDILVKRFHRLIIPFLIFSLPFMAKAIHSGKFQWWMIWMGGSQHLWFLPFIFVVTCAIAMARRRDLIVRSGPTGVAWTLVAMLSTAVEPMLSPRVPADGLLQVVNALPSVFWGIALFALPTGIPSIVHLVAIALAGVAAWSLAPGVPAFWPGAVALGCVAFAVARLLPIPATSASQFLGRTSFGVYLLHALALTVVVRTLGKLTHSPDQAMASDAYGIIVLSQVLLAIVGSIVVVAVLERTPFRRFVS